MLNKKLIFVAVCAAFTFGCGDDSGGDGGTGGGTGGTGGGTGGTGGAMVDGGDDAGDAGGDAASDGGVETAAEFCDRYETTCMFGGNERYADESACETAYDGYSAAKQECVRTHLTNAMGMMPTDVMVHCPHATGLTICDI